MIFICPLRTLLFTIPISNSHLSPCVAPEKLHIYRFLALKHGSKAWILLILHEIRYRPLEITIQFKPTSIPTVMDPITWHKNIDPQHRWIFQFFAVAKWQLMSPTDCRLYHKILDLMPCCSTTLQKHWSMAWSLTFLKCCPIKMNFSSHLLPWLHLINKWSSIFWDHVHPKKTTSLVTTSIVNAVEGWIEFKTIRNWTSSSLPYSQTTKVSINILFIYWWFPRSTL